MKKKFPQITLGFLLIAFFLSISPLLSTAQPNNFPTPTTGTITGDIANWPVWPQEVADNKINTYEPSPLTPVGRDMTAWVTFDVPYDDRQLWGETLSIMRSDGQGTVNLLSDEVRDLAHIDYFMPAATAGTLSTYLDDDGLTDDLRDGAALPGWVEDWFVTAVNWWGPVTKSPNQIFPWNSLWDSFLRTVPKARGKTFSDSGHAWPLIVWKTDGYTPAGWGEAPRLFLPTNDGLLNVLTVDDTSYSRSCAVLPGAAFPISIYQEHWNRIKGQHPRMTMLDGPITVRDVQDIDSTWHRVLVGSTGLGVDLDNKPRTAWQKEGEPVNPNSYPKNLTSGHHFALYGLNVTDPEHPTQLWTLENTHWKRNDSDNPPDLDMEYCLTRPVIGYTSNGDTRTWHALFVGLDDDGNLKWMDLDPMSGQLHGSGSIGSEKTSLSTENVYPSRMLAVYPKTGREPVLSDVYIYLSNGSLYFWNIQNGEAPRKLASFYVQGGRTGCPPVTNFDVAYSDVNHGTGNYHTYFSVIIDRNLPVGNSQSILVVDLEDLLGEDFRTASASDEWEPVDVKMQGAEGKDSTTLVGSNPFQIQLDEDHWRDTDLKTLAADPVFVDGTLYVAAYRPGYGGIDWWIPGQPEVSRLYTLPLSLFSDDGKPGNSHSRKVNLAEGTDYIDIKGEKATRFFVDSSGTLLLVDDSGFVVHSADVIDMTDETEQENVASSDMEVIYWRER